MAATEIAEFENIAASLSARTIAIAGGDREGDLLLYKYLREQAYVRQCILVGDEGEMRQAAEGLGLELAAADIMGTGSQEETAATILELARSDRADVIQKGNISTPILNRQLVKLRTRDTMSLATAFQADCFRDGATMVMTDAGVSAILNYSRMTGLIDNAVEIAQCALGLPMPKVALLAGNEKIMSALPSTGLAHDLANAPWSDAIVYGPLSFDLAVDPESVRVKKLNLPDDSPGHQVAGQADVLVNPTLDAANIMYKMLMRMAATNTARMACVTVGIKTPYIISSRSDPERSKIDSIALSCIYSNHLQKPAGSKGVAKPVEVRRTYHVLTVNPGSTSTKLSLFENRQCLKNFEVARPHQFGLKGEAMDEEVGRCVDQIKEFMNGDLPRPDAIVGRGGFLNRENQRIEGGVYRVCSVENGEVCEEEDIIKAVRDHAEMDHASNLGIPIAARLAHHFQVPAFSVDPVVSDDLQEEARYSGYAPIERKSTGHILSIRASARKAAAMIGRPFEKSGFVLVHIGGGISVAAVRNGEIVDNTIALLGEGPFTPQRAGTLPQNELIDLCFDGSFDRESLKEELTKRAGLISYIGEDSMEKIEERILDDDEKAEKAVNAMVYQIAKEVGAMNIAIGGAVDAIVLTGGLARSDRVVGKLKKRVGHLAQIIIFKDNMEMEAMAAGALAALRGQVEPRRYQLRLS
jgi:butyrate kinase